MSPQSNSGMIKQLYSVSLACKAKDVIIILFNSITFCVIFFGPFSNFSIGQEQFLEEEELITINSFQALYNLLYLP